MRKTCVGALWFRIWTIVGFGHFIFLLLLGTECVGSWGEPGPWRQTASRSSEEKELLQHSFITDLPMQQKIVYDTNMTGNALRRRGRSSQSASTEDALPTKILTSSHLSSLRDLVSEKKITIRLGLRVSLTGPTELLDPQVLLTLNKEAGIYNIGGKAGLLSMQILKIKRVTSAP